MPGIADSVARDHARPERLRTGRSNVTAIAAPNDMTRQFVSTSLGSHTSYEASPAAAPAHGADYHVAVEKRIAAASHQATRNDARALDTAVGPDERARLMTEQDAFFAAGTGATNRSNAELLQFLAGRTHWISPDGDVWNVQSIAGGVSVQRVHDADGLVSHDPLRSSTQSPGDSSDHSTSRSTGDAGTGITAAASGRVSIARDSSGSTEFTRTMASPHGVKSVEVERTAFDARGNVVGNVKIASLGARHGRQGAITVTERESTGTLVRDTTKDIERFRRVTRVDAHGKVTSSTTDAPAHATVPTTIEGIRALQDKLTSAYGDDAQSPLDAGPSMPSAAAVATWADGIEAVVNLDENKRALFAGERTIGARHAELVSEAGDESLSDVQRDLARWGATADDGNRDVERDWFDTKLKNNAVYNRRTDSMDFGVGNNGVPFALSHDVIAHEFTHRLIVAAAPNIAVTGEAGALSESLADTIASATDRDWLVAEDVWKGGVRDLSKRATKSDYQIFNNVHDNARIPNYAAYLIGSAVGRDDMGAIYTRAITEHLTNGAGFNELATDTYRSAVELYGLKSPEASAVCRAWNTVLELHGSRELFTTSG
ncbi:MAG: peptidase family protein [Thermoleophilia bacterium]|nr:peptidase family protein [Thermoleophilia bacterium]